MTAPETAKTYCVSLDDDPMIFRIIQEITKVATLPFVAGAKLLERAASLQPVAAFIDIHLGDDESGLAVLPELRRIWAQTPIIVMTSDETSSLIGDALSLGAHDFVKKPLVPDEVRARVQARIRETKQRSAGDRVAFADIVVDRGHRSVEGPLGRRSLSESDWQLLSCLLATRGMVMPKQELKGKVWGDVKVSDNAVDRKISALRQLLRDVSERVTVAAVYGKGVTITAAAAESAA